MAERQRMPGYLYGENDTIMMENIKKLSRILSKEQKRKVGLLAILILIGGVLETIGVTSILPLITAIIDQDSMLQSEMVQKICLFFGFELSRENYTQLILLLLLLVIVVIVVKNLFLLLLTYAQARFVNGNQFRTVSYMLEEYLNRPYEFYLNADIPTVFRLVDSDVPKVFTILMEYIQLASEAVVAVFLCVTLLLVDFKMTVVMGGILVFMTLLIMRVMKNRLNSMGLKSQQVQSRMGKWRLQSIYGIKDVKILHKEAFFAKNFRKYSQIAGEVTSKYTVLNNVPRLLIETLCMGGVLAYLAVYIMAGGNLTEMIPQMTAFAFAATRLLPSVNRINGHVTNIAFFQPSLDYVYENVDFSDYTKYGEYQNKDDVNAAAIPVRDAICLNNITYLYPNTTKKILDDACMRVPIGKSVGVMGPSGAGKTTAIDILMGLLQVQAGTITCGGVNIFDNYPSWLSHIGYIPQTIFLTDDSLRENIAFGVDRDEIDDKRVWQVLEEAQMKEFVEQMPEQLETSIGDRGVRLSGGQRQRIGIARALYHNPEILVFDEATSALDNDTESAIMEAIDSFHGRKTLIIIAHRLRTIENCDIIYNVDKGKIVEAKLPK